MPEFAGREVVSVGKAAGRAGVSKRTIYTWLQNGKIEHVRSAGGRVLIFVDSLFKPQCNGYTPRGPHVDAK